MKRPKPPLDHDPLLCGRQHDLIVGQKAPAPAPAPARQIGAGRGLARASVAYQQPGSAVGRERRRRVHQRATEPRDEQRGSDREHRVEIRRRAVAARGVDGEPRATRGQAHRAAARRQRATEPHYAARLVYPRAHAAE